MDNIGAVVSALLAAIIGVAIVAVVVSKNSNTAGVLSAAGTSFAGILSVAVSPVTGAAAAIGSASPAASLGSVANGAQAALFGAGAVGSFMGGMNSGGSDPFGGAGTNLGGLGAVAGLFNGNSAG